MIIRQQEDALLLIRQPEHARVAGLFASHWKVTAFRGHERFEEVLHAVRQHDDCWEEADKVPLLNKEEGRPYSFDNYPEVPKTAFYKQGIDRMEKQHPYAALLCSKHFAAFFAPDTSDVSREFYRSEILRQEKLVQQLGLEREEQTDMEFHFRLLQFCDNLSLFICLNEPGKNGHPWFRKGFPDSEKLGLGNKVVKAAWDNTHTIRATPFPFDGPFNVSLNYRELPLPLPGKQEKLNDLWKEAPLLSMEFTIR